MFNRITLKLTARTAAALGGLVFGLFATTADAAPPSLFPFLLLPAPMQLEPQGLPPQIQAYAPTDEGTPVEQPSRFKRQTVGYATREAPGTIVVDTANTYLYITCSATDRRSATASASAATASLGRASRP